MLLRTMQNQRSARVDPMRKTVPVALAHPTHPDPPDVSSAPLVVAADLTNARVNEQLSIG
jgi:hypothetical protein